MLLPIVAIPLTFKSAALTLDVLKPVTVAIPDEITETEIPSAKLIFDAAPLLALLSSIVTPTPTAVIPVIPEPSPWKVVAVTMPDKFRLPDIC